jgi:Ca2+-binding RTX toxin-like protein
LYGGDGDDEIRGLGGNDEISGGSGDDVIYGGDGDDHFVPDSGNDVIYAGNGNEMISTLSDKEERDKLYCGAGRDKYRADPTDYVDSSCETASASALYVSGHDVISASASSASPVAVPTSGGPAILLPTAALLLLGSGSILTYAIFRRR